jgi:predicted lipid-binding transport protein (Tim44 family)
MISKFLSIAATTAFLIGMTALGQAQSSSQRMPDSTPGQKMQDRGSAPGQPGASGHTPGHQMQKKGSRAGEPGASGYAPGHQEPSTTGRGSMGGRDPDRGRGDER